MMSAYKINSFNTLTVHARRMSPLPSQSFRRSVIRDTKSIARRPHRADVSRVGIAVRESDAAHRGVRDPARSMAPLRAVQRVELAVLRRPAASTRKWPHCVRSGLLPEPWPSPVLLEAIVAGACWRGHRRRKFRMRSSMAASISTLGGAPLTAQLVYSLSITPTLTITVILLACALGLASGHRARNSCGAIKHRPIPSTKPRNPRMWCMGYTAFPKQNQG